MSVSFLFLVPTESKPKAKQPVVIPVQCESCKRMMDIQNAVPIVWKESKRVYGYVCKRPRYSGSRQLWPCHENVLQKHPHPEQIYIRGTGPFSFNPPPLPREFKKAPKSKRRFQPVHNAFPEPFAVAAV